MGLTLAVRHGVNLLVVEVTPMSVLPDIIDINLRLLICGYNAGPVSARTGHYFSNPKHRVWKTLYEVKLTPGILTPEEDGELLQYGIGLTDLMKNSIHGDGTTPTDWDRDLLREKVLRYQPDNLVFLGKRPAKGFLGYEPEWGSLGLAYPVVTHVH